MQDDPSPASLRDRLRRRWEAEPGRCAALAAIVLALALLLAYLLLAPKPWSPRVARALARGDLDVEDYLVLWLWYASAINAVLLAVALATRRLWLRTGPVPERSELAPPASRPSAPWIVLVAGAVLAGSALAAPRLSHSLWTDEIFSVRRALDGYWRPQDDGSGLEFRAASWVDTFFYYRTPNNHVPYNVLARLSLEAWQAVNLEPGSGTRFGEAAMRLPAFLLGGASIVAAGALWWRAGFPAAGLLLAWILALHPWHVRYASEIRGYSLLLLLVSVQLTALLAAFGRGSYGRWLLYGASQVLILWTYPLTALLVVVTNLCALAALVSLHGLGPAGRAQLLRWAVVNVASALVLVQVFGPLVPQVLRYTVEQHKEKASTSGLVYARNVASHLYLGMPYRVTKRPAPPYPQLYDVDLGALPGSLRAGAVLTLLAVGAGAVRLWRAGGGLRPLLPILLLPGPLTWLAAWLSRMYLWEWYLLFMLPTWGALFALGVSWPMRAPLPGARAAGAALCALVLVAFAVASEPMRAFQRAHPIQPRRESVLLTRAELDPLAPSQRGVLTASFFVAPDTYDPNVVHLDEPADLDALMARADREGLPLYVNIGWADHATRREPELVGRVRQEDLFELVAELPGLKPRFTRLVYRYRGGPGPSGSRGSGRRPG